MRNYDSSKGSVLMKRLKNTNLVYEHNSWHLYQAESWFVVIPCAIAGRMLVYLLCVGDLQQQKSFQNTAVFVLCCRLRDESTPVRKNTLLVLSHLILNDMIKVKGQISEMATCIIDDNAQIAGLARVFFSDLAKRV